MVIKIMRFIYYTKIIRTSIESKLRDLNTTQPYSITKNAQKKLSKQKTREKNVCAFSNDARLLCIYVYLIMDMLFFVHSILIILLCEQTMSCQPFGSQLHLKIICQNIVIGYNFINISKVNLKKQVFEVFVVENFKYIYFLVQNVLHQRRN